MRGDPVPETRDLDPTPSESIECDVNGSIPVECVVHCMTNSNGRGSDTARYYKGVSLSRFADVAEDRE